MELINVLPWIVKRCYSSQQALQHGVSPKLKFRTESPKIQSVNLMGADLIGSVVCRGEL
jgi:hypothetical protein